MSATPAAAARPAMPMEPPIAINELIELTKKALNLVTEMNDRSKNNDSTVAILGSLFNGLINYAAQHATSIQEKVNAIYAAISTSNRVEEKVNAIHAAIATMNATMLNTEKTWAQIAASNTTTALVKAKPMVSPEKAQQREQAKQKREQYEVTLSANTASEETKNIINKQQPKDLKMQFQKAIDAANIPVKPKIFSINKLPKYTIRLQFKTTEHAESTQKASINWNIAYQGTKAYKLIYGIVVHGVGSDAINLNMDHDNTIKEWEEGNSDCAIKITKVQPLRRTAKHRSTLHYSLKIYTEDKEAANRCIEHGFVIVMNDSPDKFSCATSSCDATALWGTASQLGTASTCGPTSLWGTTSQLDTASTCGPTLQKPGTTATATGDRGQSSVHKIFTQHVDFFSLQQ